MKKIVLAMLLVMSYSFVQAQKDFEGKIIYSVHTDTNEKDDLELTILIAKKKLKFSSIKKSNGFPDKNFSIVNIDSEKIYTLNRYDSTFTIKKLKVKQKTILPDKKVIAGYSTTPFSEDPKMAIFGSYMMQTNTVIFPADSLFYTIPEKFDDNLEFIFINKNKIVLGVQAYIDYGGMALDMDTTSKKVAVSAEAKEIIPMQIADSEFEIPIGFVNLKDKYIEPYFPHDSIKAIMDSYPDSLIQAPPKYTPKKGSKKPLPRKKTSPVKPSAIIRKP